MAPWIAAGAAVVVTLVVVGVRYLGSTTGGPPTPGRAATSQSSARPPSGAPDITSMTPRERADRLFERIMIAQERGDSNEVRFFSPMALQAYDMVGDPDADARYHVALIHAASATAGAARAQADSIRLLEPDHLFATIIDAAVAELEGSDEARRTAYRRFLDTYEAELAAARPEYRDHQNALDAFRREASEALGQPGRNE